MQKTSSLCVGLFLSAVCAGAQAVNVADFGAVPNDGKCDKLAIRKAAEEAKKAGASSLVFDAGIYDLFIDDPTKEVGLDLFNFENFTVEGKAAADGSPATKFVRHYKYAENMLALQILRASDCKNISVKNLAFDNSPRYSTAGKVVKNDGETLVFEIFKGNPAIDGCVFYCGNAWDLETRTLKKIPSLTYGNDVDENRDAHRVRLLPQKGKNGADMMELRNAKVAAMLEAGDGVSWCFGHLGNVFTIRTSEDIFVENVTIFNAIGFCASISRSKNIGVKKFEVRAPDNQLAVGSRDGLILPDNTGRVTMDGMYMEGIRWDGQNALGMFLWLREIESENGAVFKSHRGNVMTKIREGTKLGIYVSEDEEARLTVKTSEIFKEDGKYFYRLTFAEKLPENLDDKMPACPYSWDMTEYTVKNSHFKNIAGSASLVRNSNVKIENCTYEYIMYPAVMIGPAIGEQEGPVAKDILVENCLFKTCGWEARHKAYGAIAAKVQPMSHHKKIKPYMRNIRILNNTIEDCAIGMQIEDAIGVKIRGNKFKNVETPLVDNNLKEEDISL